MISEIVGIALLAAVCIALGTLIITVLALVLGDKEEQ